MKILSIAILCVLLSSCATEADRLANEKWRSELLAKEAAENAIKNEKRAKQTLTNALNLKIGQSQEEVIALLSGPISSSANEAVTILHYKLYPDNNTFNFSTEPFAVSFRDGKVVGFGVEQDKLAIQKEEARFINEKNERDLANVKEAKRLRNQNMWNAVGAVGEQMDKDRQAQQAEKNKPRQVIRRGDVQTQCQTVGNTTNCTSSR